MVDVEECSLRAFKQDLFAAIDRFVQVDDRICHVRPQFFTGSKIRFIDIAKTDRLRTKGVKDSIVLQNFCLQLLREHDRLHEVRHSQASACCLVSVGGANSSFGSANPSPTQLSLLVEHAVIRQDKMGAIADEQVFMNAHSQLAQAFHFSHKREWIDDYTVSDHAYFALPKDP